MSSRRPEPGEWKRIVLRLAVTVVVVGAAYVGLAFYLGQHVPSGTSVAGVDIGGMTKQRASQTLRDALSSRASAPIKLQVVDDTVSLDPARAGLQLDVDRTLEGLTGVTYAPQQVWDHLTGGQQQPLKVHIDRARLESALQGAATKIDTAPRKGSVTFEDGRAVTTLPQAGRVLKVGPTADAISAAWPRRPQVTATVAVTEPEVSAAKIRAAAKAFAKPAMSGSLRVKVGKKAFSLTPAQLSRVLTMQPDGHGALKPRIDAEALLKTARDVAPGIEKDAVNATVRLVDGKPEVIPGSTGLRLKAPSLAKAVLPALTSKKRVATVDATTVQPRVTTKEAKDWGVKEVISEFHSRFPTGGEENDLRTHNIRTALGHLNGTLVEPGKQFSLLGILGETTKAKGYVRAGVISGGRLVLGWGGGISQVSTTVFNASYFAGVQLDEHTPHSYYIPRYPVGREATMWNPTIDNKWTNNTGHAILIQTYITGDEIVMKFWGTDVFSVSSHTGPRRNLVPPKHIVDHSAHCLTEYPMPGFDITVTRTVRRGGAVVDHNVFNTHYQPENQVTCAG